MPRSHVSTEHEILVAAYKTVTLSRVAIIPVAADLWMKVRVVFINGNSFSAAIAVGVAGGEVSLRDIITAAYLEGGYGVRSAGTISIGYRLRRITPFTTTRGQC